jgi:hypothetical protein
MPVMARQSRQGRIEAEHRGRRQHQLARGCGRCSTNIPGSVDLRAQAPGPGSAHVQWPRSFKWPLSSAGLGAWPVIGQDRFQHRPQIAPLAIGRCSRTRWATRPLDIARAGVAGHQASGFARSEPRTAPHSGGCNTDVERRIPGPGVTVWPAGMATDRPTGVLDCPCRGCSGRGSIRPTKYSPVGGTRRFPPGAVG